jgi:hypothetical protein
MGFLIWQYLEKICTVLQRIRSAVYLKGESTMHLSYDSAEERRL